MVRSPRDDDNVRRLGAAFLGLQGAGALVWWGVLLLAPRARRPFLAPGAPDATLLAFAAADWPLFVGGSLAGAYALARRRSWAWPVLCVHAGAACYAALYALALPILSGGGWLGAALMAPSLIGPPYLAWRLRPEG
jgi:hypothetical protein